VVYFLNDKKLEKEDFVLYARLSYRREGREYYQVHTNVRIFE